MDPKTMFKLPQEVFSIAPLLRRFPLSVAQHMSLYQYPEPTAENPVLLIPGLGASPHSMYWLKHQLMAQGYRVYSSTIFRNVGSFELQGPDLHDRILEITDKTSRPVDIVGWSMGGRYAVRLTEDHSQNIGKIITLGSPLRAVMMSDAMEMAWRIALLLVNIPIDPIREEMEQESQLPGRQNPLSAIIGYFDAVVSDESTVIPDSKLSKRSRRENIYVEKGHTALGFSTIVRDIILDRLEQRVSSWKPYTTAAH